MGCIGLTPLGHDFGLLRLRGNTNGAVPSRVNWRGPQSFMHETPHRQAAHPGHHGGMTIFKDHWVNVGAIRTRYWQAGNQGSPVLLLHGIGCSAREWDKSLATMGQRHRVFALDMLGSGHTDAPAQEDYSLDRLARFALDFATQVGVDRFHVAGNSLGGRLALACAMQAPKRIASLLLADPAGVGLHTFINFRLATLPGLGEVLTRPNRMGLRMLWRKAYFDPSMLEESRVDEKLADAKREGAQAAFLKTLRGFVGLRGFLPGPLQQVLAAAPNLPQPTLIVWGQQDHLLPVAQGRALAASMKHAECVVLDRCGHLPQLEHPEAFNQKALAFWARVDAAN